MNTLVLVPGPPLRVIWIPGTRASTSATPPGPWRSMVLLSMMDMSAVKSDSGCSMRLAVTTIASRVLPSVSFAVWACADRLAAIRAAATAMRVCGEYNEEKTIAESGAHRRTTGEWECIYISGDEVPRASLPAGKWGKTEAARSAAHRHPQCWPVSGLTMTQRAPSQRLVQGIQWLRVRAAEGKIPSIAYRCGGSAG
ncbi:hypothetical protein D3C72_1756070 [compost metagenome]